MNHIFVVLIALAVLVAVFLLICLVIGFGTTIFVTRPKRPSYEKAEAIEKSKNFWGDYDSYEKEEWNIESFDGYTLHGILIKNDSDKYVIITHGYIYNRMGSVKYANLFYKLGFNVYIYDLRHFGQNKPTYCSMGHNEPRDIICIQEALYKRFGENITIGLHGESLGCASSILALGLSQKFSFVVADCGFYELQPLLKDLAGKMLHLPGFMQYFTDVWMTLVHHYQFAIIRPIDVMEHNEVPILFFHGADDNFILPWHSEKAFKACHSYKELYLIEGAEHAESYFKNPEGYASKVEHFLNQICFFTR